MRTLKDSYEHDRGLNETIDEVGKTKHKKTLLNCKESKDRQHVSALLFYKAITTRITIISVLGTMVIDRFPEFVYNYILSKTNEISFNTHLHTQLHN